MADEGNRDRPTDERFGRRVHEGMNGGISRRAHTTGEYLAGGRDAESSPAERSDAAREAGEPPAAGQGGVPNRGEGGYGDDTGYTGGTRAAGTSNTGAGETGMNTGGAGTPSGTNTGGAGGTTGGQHRTHTAWAGTPSVSHHEGVGSEAPSGMEELEHDRLERGERGER
jgi:hypothetical protein